MYFPLAAIARDSTAWDNPDEFKPQRFLSCKDASQGTDGTIKMMPFGAGRRMCPGIDISLLHVNLLVATMVRAFQWSEVPGEPVDFTETLELTIVMKRPLRAKVVPCHATS